MEKKNIELGQVSDASWLIALWKYIHGGDPASSDQIVAANIVASMAKYLQGEPGTTPSATLQSRFRETEGLVTVTRRALSQDPPDISVKVTQALQASMPSGWHCCEYEEICIGTGHKKVCHQVCIQRVPSGTQCQ